MDLVVRYVVVAAVALALDRAFPTSVAIVALLATVVIGFPHGAADWQRLNRIDPRLLTRVALYAGYVVLATVTALLTLWQPAPTLLALILLSVWHFGNTASGRPQLCQIGLALVVIAGPTWAHPELVASYFASLGWTIAPYLIGTVGKFAATIGVLLGLIGGRGWLGRGTAVMALLFAFLLQPITSFALYFCLLHAPWHERHLREERGARPAQARTLVLTGIAAVAIAGLALSAIANGAAIEPALARGLIVVILALTVPHMALDMWTLRRRDISAALDQLKQVKRRRRNR